MKNYSKRIAEFAAGLKYSDIPHEVVEKVKLLFLDTVGLAIAGSACKEACILYQVIQQLGEGDACSLIGSATRVPLPSAVLLNSTLAHSLDFDDTHVQAIVHPSACIVPTAFAAAEALHLSGKDLITALVTGYETMIRVGLAASGAFHDRGFHATPFCGVFGAAAATGKTYGCSSLDYEHAFGICGSQAAGLQEFLNDGTWVKRLHAGWAAHGGVIAALLANGGYTGPYKVFEGRFGLFPSFFPEATFNLNALCEGLGSRWETLSIALKPYPCCYFIHSYLDCVRQIKEEQNLDISDIEEISCYVNPRTFSITCEPYEDKIRPSTVYGAQFSLPFSVAMIISRGEYSLSGLTPQILNDEEILHLAPKVKCVEDDEMVCKGFFPGSVGIKIKDGRIFEREQRYQRGSSKNPMTNDEVSEKLISNVGSKLSKKQISDLVSCVLSLEQLEDVNTLSSLLQFEGPLGAN